MQETLGPDVLCHTKRAYRRRGMRQRLLVSLASHAIRDEPLRAVLQIYRDRRSSPRVVSPATELCKTETLAIQNAAEDIDYDFPTAASPSFSPTLRYRLEHPKVAPVPPVNHQERPSRFESLSCG